MSERPAGRAMRLVGHLVSTGAIPPAAGAVVMGTGIVSIALTLDGYETLGRILVAISAVVWVILAVLVLFRARGNRGHFMAGIRTAPALTSVAGTAVLGTGLVLLGWTWAGIPALVIVAVLWALLIGPVLRHLKTPTDGGSLMLTVATESLAVLAATVGVVERTDWLIVAALAPFALGLWFYVVVIAHFDVRQLTVGRGDHWITGGALAISTLAAGKIVEGAKALAVLGDGGGIPKYIALALWVLTMLWLPVLLLAELSRRQLRYDVRRWATVFPVGMYAACSFVVGEVAAAPGITTFARAWTWVAFAVWAIVVAALLRRAAIFVRYPR